MKVKWKNEKKTIFLIQIQIEIFKYFSWPLVTLFPSIIMNTFVVVVADVVTIISWYL